MDENDFMKIEKAEPPPMEPKAWEMVASLKVGERLLYPKSKGAAYAMVVYVVKKKMLAKVENFRLEKHRRFGTYIYRVS